MVATSCNSISVIEYFAASEVNDLWRDISVHIINCLSNVIHCMGQNVKSLAGFGPNISKTVENRGSVPMDHHYEIAYGESNGHMTNDVT